MSLNTPNNTPSYITKNEFFIYINNGDSIECKGCHKGAIFISLFKGGHNILSAAEYIKRKL